MLGSCGPTEDRHNPIEIGNFWKLSENVLSLNHSVFPSVWKILLFVR